jgi:clan AA aspartic protease
MGITFAKVAISHPRTPGRHTIELEFLIDTGAVYSVVPAVVLRKLGIRRHHRETFTLADGTTRTYAVAEAFFALGSRDGTSKVVFGPPGATPLLGALTLESLGLMVNPVTRELVPMRLLLAAAG